MIAAGHVSFENSMAFKCETDYPYAFAVTYRIKKGGKLALRIPGWSQNTRIDINGEALTLRPVNGYQYMRIEDGDVVRLELDDNARTIYVSTKIPQLTGKVALCWGLLVYCFEGVDNDWDVLPLALKRGGRIAVAPFDADLLGSTVYLSIDAVRRKDSGCLYSSSLHTETDSNSSCPSSLS